MKLGIFLEKFDQLVAAPDAVEKMRELIRHLAVTGKLVAQDPHDESGELLLQKINAERLVALKARHISPLKSLPAIRGDELLFELQTGWAAARLNELVMEIQTGPFGSSLHKSDYQLGGIPVVNPASLKAGKIVPIEQMAIGQATLKRLEVFKLRAGDIVMARRGEMGRCAIVTKNEEGWLCGTGSLVLRIPNSMYAPYLAMLIGAPMARAYLGGASVGTTMQNLNQSILAKMPVGVPPLAEQKRIVAKVNELMKLCDRLQAHQRERQVRHAALARASLARFAAAPTPANLSFLFHPSYDIAPADLRKSILTLAVRGKLVPQDPNDEAAEVTLAKVLRDREFQERSLRIKEPIPVEADAEHTPDLPSKWCYASPDQITAFQKNALTIGPFGSSLLKSDYTDDGVPLVFVRDIRSESFGGPETRFVSPEKAEELASHTVRPGDLLITKMGDPPGDTAIYPKARPPAIITADCIKLTPHTDLVSGEYLGFTIRASQIAEQFAVITLGVAQQKVSLGRFRCIAIPVPPLAEQRRIVAKIKQLMALVDELERQIGASRATAANLLSAAVAELSYVGRLPTPTAVVELTPSVLAKAFRGELIS
jgi:type I restriction enzyme, S subunit